MFLLINEKDFQYEQVILKKWHSKKENMNIFKNK